jgi:Rha family phage regulatory protein
MWLGYSMTEIIPTKADLLKTDIVAINQHHKKVITNTIQLANHFLKRPSEINRRIALLSNKGLCRIVPSYYLNQQAKKQKYYELTRDEFLLVVMGFTGSKADKFKSDFIKLFNHQEAELTQWRAGRLIASDMTKAANDEIYWLKNKLAETIPTSKRCVMIFIHIQKRITKVATGSANTIRESMTSSQLHQVTELEQQVQDYIKQLRVEGVDPVQIRDNTMAMIQASNGV